MAINHFQSSRGQVIYDKRGWGDPLILVHGIYPGASRHEFHRNIDFLSRSFTTYAIDLLGFGDSEMPRMTYTVDFYQRLLRDFIVEELGQPVHVMASGASCGIAVSLAIYNSGLLRRLVLIDPASPPRTDEHPEDVKIAARVQQFLLGTLSLGVGLYQSASNPVELRRFLRSRYAKPDRVRDEQVRTLHERATRHHAMFGIISKITGHLNADVPRWLRSVHCPTLLVYGQHVSENRPAHLPDYIEAQTIPNAAHWPHDEQSAKFNAMATEYLNTAAVVA